MSTLVICLIACHGAGPADHLATYAEVLTNKGYDVRVHASGPALTKFKERGFKQVVPFDLDTLGAQAQDALASQIAKTCAAAAAVITDVGHPFDLKMQHALSKDAPLAVRFSYYDNPEPFVPGGYSETAKEVMLASEGILFANAHLADGKIYSSRDVEVDFSGKKRTGIGYYPVGHAEKMAVRRKNEHSGMRASFLEKQGLQDKDQKVLVYFGGNNEVYFLKAFPAFLSLLAQASANVDLRDTVVVVQQHPGAKTKNLDGQLVNEWVKTFGNDAGMPKLMLSDYSSDDAQVLADGALYYQTSMGPQFILEGIPTLQIGHETYEDLLVKNGLAPSVTNVEDFCRVLKDLKQEGEPAPRGQVLQGLGMRDDWQEVLLNAMETAMTASQPAGKLGDHAP